MDIFNLFLYYTYTISLIPLSISLSLSVSRISLIPYSYSSVNISMVLEDTWTWILFYFLFQSFFPPLSHSLCVKYNEWVRSKRKFHWIIKLRICALTSDSVIPYVRIWSSSSRNCSLTSARVIAVLHW